MLTAPGRSLQANDEATQSRDIQFKKKNSQSLKILNLYPNSHIHAVQVQNTMITFLLKLAGCWTLPAAFSPWLGIVIAKRTHGGGRWLTKPSCLRNQ